MLCRGKTREHPPTRAFAAPAGLSCPLTLAVTGRTARMRALRPGGRRWSLGAGGAVFVLLGALWPVPGMGFGGERAHAAGLTRGGGIVGESRRRIVKGRARQTREGPEGRRHERR
ncbi:hypothetical protein GCM10010112_37750 [Actinoplanes lobatus]|nr:hypothetical protein GCM10010112_37750 [Actinoplanes lobatus]